MSLIFGDVVSAESWTEMEVDVLLDPEGNRGGITSTPFALDIHGSGYLNFAELSADSSETEEPDITLDAAIFFLRKKPEDVYQWQSDSIGVLSDDGSKHLCCTSSTQKLSAANGGGNVCTTDQIGQLIVSTDNNPNILKVQHRSFALTKYVGMEGVVSVDESEHMVLVFGYCDDIIEDREKAPSVHVKGTLIWVSYVSGGTVVLYAMLTAVTVALSLWYHKLMTIHVSSRIKIEEWILKVLCLCSASMGLQTILIATEVYLENEIVFLEFIADVSSSVAAAASRCLYLVLALGLGVITSNLSKVTESVLSVCLGSYVLGYLAINAMDFTDRGSIIAMFENVVLVLDVVFLVWIPCALCATMRYLNRNGEETKLVRYRWILKIYFLMIFLSMVQIFLFFWDMIKNAGRNYDLESVREGNQVIHLVVLACIAILWKPNPSQQQYSYILLEDNDGNENVVSNNTAGITDLELAEVVKSEQVVIENSPMQESLGSENRVV